MKQYLMRIRKMLPPLGVTAIAAVAILLVGALLFTGVWALLPDRTDETHSYDAPSFGNTADEPPVLYPWNLMTTPWKDGEISLDETDLYNLLYPLLAPYFSSSWHIENWSNGEFLYDKTHAMFGFRNIDVRARSNTNLIVDTDGRQETESYIIELRFSLALREWEDTTEICFLSLEPPPREQALPSAEEAGLNVLYAWTEKRDLNLASGSPFAEFLWRFVDFGAILGYEYDSYNTAFQLFETGSCEVTLVDHVVYCTFTGREGVMTLLCDPIYQSVYGISMQRYN